MVQAAACGACRPEGGEMPPPPAGRMDQAFWSSLSPPPRPRHLPSRVGGCSWPGAPQAARRVVGGRWRPASSSYGERRLPLHSGGWETRCDVRRRPRPGPAVLLAFLHEGRGSWPGIAEGRPRSASREPGVWGSPFPAGGAPALPRGLGDSFPLWAATGLLQPRKLTCAAGRPAARPAVASRLAQPDAARSSCGSAGTHLSAARDESVSSDAPRLLRV